MAKRTLGLAKAAKAKKQKREGTSQGASEEAGDNEEQLTVELPEGIDANDEVAQLEALYRKYMDSEKDNELLVNGIVHECDSLLRSAEDTKVTLPALFHSIYGRALAELAKCVPDDDEDKERKQKEYIDAALERIEIGFEKFPDDAHLLVAKAKILLAQLFYQHVSKVTPTSRKEDLDVDIENVLDSVLEVYASGETKAIEVKNFAVFKGPDATSFLEAFDDLLSLIALHGNEIPDEEDDFGDDEEDIVVNELAEDHPFFGIRNSDKYNIWWKDHLETFLDTLKKLDRKEVSDTLWRYINRKLGQCFLEEAERPSRVFTTLKYEDDFQGIEELEGLSLKEAETMAKELMTKALEYLQGAKDEEDPDTWVDLAEAMISMGNLQEMESKEQEELYDEAEDILRKANNATNGKYTDVLDNLLEIY
ncbi:Enhancer of translation termination 1 [Candida viswanathii]|uniref:Enhancer of translation termination 1 n=1 Tax=Candida viswanathii TaxID=5486 RepID=A0A367YNZ7_9ASCO|nr:Enhancer of translation termination 1 [Candida viswanathii]